MAANLSQTHIFTHGTLNPFLSVSNLLHSENVAQQIMRHWKISIKKEHILYKYIIERWWVVTSCNLHSGFIPRYIHGQMFCGTSACLIVFLAYIHDVDVKDTDKYCFVNVLWMHALLRNDTIEEKNQHWSDPDYSWTSMHWIHLHKSLKVNLTS